jgi:hypothetical protein
MNAKQIIDALKGRSLNEVQIVKLVQAAGYEVSQPTINRVARGITRNPGSQVLLGLQSVYTSLVLTQSKDRAA